MSVKITTLVWEYSQHRGTALNVMLAIADFADDDGGAFPGTDRLAWKSRVRKRNLFLILKRLVKSNELIIDHKNGIRTGSGQWTNRYIIQVDFLIRRGAREYTSSDEEEVQGNASLEVQRDSSLPGKEVNPIAPKPSDSKNQPSGESSGETTSEGGEGNIFTLWAEAFGEKTAERAMTSSMLRETLIGLQAEFALDDIREGLRQTVLANARSPVKYLQTVLERQREKGDRNDNNRYTGGKYGDFIQH